MNPFSEADIRDLDVELKIGVLGTVTPDGEPHLTLLSSMRPYAADKMVWGQFTEGISKEYIRNNPKTGFLLMTLNKEVWYGKTLFTRTAKDGPEMEGYNNQPMFRYNAYFGVHTAFYMDVVNNTGRQALPMGKVIFAAVKTMLARLLTKKTSQPPVLNQWGQALFNKVDNLKFLSYIDVDGFPVVLPVVQAQALDAKRIGFALGAYSEALKKILDGARIAVFAMSFDMEDVLVRGTFNGFSRVGGVNCGVVEMDWVYNPMPPKPQQIYPPVPVEPVREF